MNDYSTILVPYDFSSHARTALDTASDFATRLDAEVHLVFVVEPPSYLYAGHLFGGTAGLQAPFDTSELRAGAQSALQDVADTVSGRARPSGSSRKIHAHVIEGGGIARLIQDFATELGADLIVMGTHGRTGLAQVFVGSVAERTIRDAPCPVLTVQAPESDDNEQTGSEPD